MLYHMSNIFDIPFFRYLSLLVTGKFNLFEESFKGEIIIEKKVIIGR